MLKASLSARLDRAHSIRAPLIAVSRSGMITAFILSIAFIPPTLANPLSADIVSAHHPDHDEPLPDDTVDTLDTTGGIPPNAGRIIGSPEPGPPPAHQGDRGGYLQLATLAALTAGIGFISWRVTRATRSQIR